MRVIRLDRWNGELGKEFPAETSVDDQVVVDGVIGAVPGPVIVAPAEPIPALGFGRWLLLAGLLLIAWRGFSMRKKHRQQ